MKNLIIIGCGGFAREIYWHAQKSIGFGVEWQIKGFLDGDIKLSAAEYELLPDKVLGDVDSYEICAEKKLTATVPRPRRFFFQTVWAATCPEKFLRLRKMTE